MSEPRDIRLKRLRMRSMRRGIREMDLILTAFAEQALENLDEDGLALYEDLLSQNDQDLYSWVTGQQEAPSHLSGIIHKIASTLRRN